MNTGLHVHVAVALLIGVGGCGSPSASPVQVPPTPAPAVNPHPEHHHDGGMADHMANMGRVRNALRAALGLAYEAPVPGLDKSDRDHGKLVFDQNCAICHGATGRGDGEAGKALHPPPSDMTDAFHARYYSDAGRVYVIRYGAPGTAMPAWGSSLTDTEILDVYAYIANLRGAALPDVGEGGHHVDDAKP